MSERLREKTSKRAIAAIAAALTLGACTEAGTDRSPALLERCYDAPQPHQKQARTPQTPITLHYIPATRHIAEQPTPDEAVERRLETANVRIEDDDSYGSGFITTDNHGQKIISTAAHVVANKDLSTLTVTTNDGERIRISSGCYLYENKGQFKTLNEKDARIGLAEYDVAILRPARPPESRPVAIAQEYPERGTWVQFINNQLDTLPSYPSKYYGLVISKHPGDIGNAVLTGLQPWKETISGQDSYTAGPGSSGGLIGSVTRPEVVAMQVGSSQNHHSAAVIKELYGVAFDAPVGKGTGIIPVPATVVTAGTLHTAIDSDSY